MGSRTPFYDKNRKLMFDGIINLEPSFPPHFTNAAKTILLELLHKESTQRLGTNGAREIKNTNFFMPIDFKKLLMFLQLRTQHRVLFSLSLPSLYFPKFTSQ